MYFIEIFVTMGSHLDTVKSEYNDMRKFISRSLSLGGGAGAENKRNE